MALQVVDNVSSFEPADNLANRTFIGLIIAQFLAGFNDQAIHTSAMFYAIHSQILTEAGAITLMPILFFAPWAVFCTVSGYLADRYSKTISLRIWKLAEIVISLVLILGFALGAGNVGPWVVMACVVMMGTHGAFFAPAKYGAMPEILKPHVLSRGNGILESTTFLATILGTVSGGLLTRAFRHQEVWIGVILLTLSVIGALASFLIARLPAANPRARLPFNIYQPLWNNLRTLFQAKPLTLAVLGIAFFIFMVSYMRAAVYMHGETRNPRWDEFKTSLTVATVALGVGLGSPLAGYLSGGKVELGLVPLGTLGMFAATILAAVAIEQRAALIVALVIIGFFSGFYMVPLYTLLQHRAPKKSKGELVATSNFINVTGAMVASALFGFLVFMSQRTGVTPQVPGVRDVAKGTLTRLEFDKHGRVEEIRVQGEEGEEHVYHSKWDLPKADPDFYEALEQIALFDDENRQNESILFDENEFRGRALKEGDDVIISQYELRGVKHTVVRPASQTALPEIYDKESLPRYLFLGGALMTLAILGLLRALLPDFFVRALFWLRCLGRYRIQANGTQFLPTRGPVILATNASTLDSTLELVSATDRATRVVLIERSPLREGSPLLRLMARRSTLIELCEGELTSEAWERARREGAKALGQGRILAISVDGEHPAEVEALVEELQRASGAPLLPTFVGPVEDPRHPGQQVVVVFGQPLTTLPSLNEIRKAIHNLAESAREQDAAVAAH